jgi:hypothetical protein
MEGRGLQVDQDTQQPILWHGQRTVLVSRIPTGGARSSVEAPFSHMDLERGLKRRGQLLKLYHGDTGEIGHLWMPALKVGEP